MRIFTLVDNEYEENTYIVIDGKEAVIIDPGAPFDKIQTIINQQQATAICVLLTHGHGDHIISLHNFSKEIIYAHIDEKPILSDPKKNLAAMTGGDLSVTGINFFKGDKFNLELGVKSSELKHIEIYHTPGHTPGGCVIKIGDDIFTGDTLFEDTVGRTDLPGGDSKKLRNSIKIFDSFNKDCTMYPGHGTPFKLGDSYKINYFLSR
jgi:glyoxylase-like metal-dependent hydrolase (beta-lactamase superfamily II)